MRHVHRVIGSVTCVQGYQKCDMRHVHRVIRNVTWDMCTGLSEMWHETCIQGYHKCDMRHVHRVIRNVTWAQGYQKCDMRHLHRVIGNVTWYMCTGLSEIWHETCAHFVCVYDVRRSCVFYCVGLCLLLCGGCVCYCEWVVFVVMWGLCSLLCGACVCYCLWVVFVVVWGLCVLLSVLFGCSNLITYEGCSLIYLPK